MKCSIYYNWEHQYINIRALGGVLVELLSLMSHQQEAMLANWDTACGLTGFDQ